MEQLLRSGTVAMLKLQELRSWEGGQAVPKFNSRYVQRERPPLSCLTGLQKIDISL